MTGFRSSEFRVRVGVMLGLAAAVATAAAQNATRTPTPAPRLSGGFGRPRATPPPVAAPEASDGGQSLAGAVHAAKEARDGQAPEKSGLTINNRSLVRSPEKGRVSTSKVAPARGAPSPASGQPPREATANRSGEAAPVTPGAAPSSLSAAAGTEAEWRETAARARRRVVEAKARAGELDETARKLENDFYAWDDGQYRDRVIKPAWDRARAELETARRELAVAEKDLADLPEKARKAGALPGWIRE